MHLTYSKKSLVFGLLGSTLCLGLVACDVDGDLGKDSQTGGSGDESESGADSNSGQDTAESDSGGGDSGDSGDSGGTACTEDDCGPAPGAAAMCPDGETIANWICVDDGEGVCGWEMEDCPTIEPCTEEECGPAPGAPNMLCPDGVNYSGPGPCERNDEGICGYTWLECPSCCDPALLPDCVEPITCCADGTWVCGEVSDCGEAGEGLTCAGGSCQQMGDSCANGETCCEGLYCCAGVPVDPGEEYCGDVCPISDRNKKENFASVDVDAVLAKVAGLDISTWNYTFQEPKFRHLGPMAQDFKAAFEIGHTDKAILQVDADGVALASIQALNGRVETLRAENDQLKATLAAMQKRLEKLEGK